MREHPRPSNWIVCGLALLAAAGCSPAPEAWTPVPQESSTTFLDSEVETAAAHVRSARSALPADPEGAAAELAGAEEALTRLLGYYLPLLDARGRAYDAYRHYRMGRTRETERELAEIEKILIRVAGGGGETLLREMEAPLEKLGDARAALASGADEAGEDLEALASRLHFLLVRGGLVLGR
ncbi:MAG: hypothetical protein R3325_15060 [Thermoanaerobaculia bacterium]|nr:hypothetical protein [Thermoanaerobaculia bacterium]